MFQRLPRGGHTRSLSEHGSQAPHRRWYLAHGPGRVGRRWIHGAPCLKGEGLLFLYTAPLRYALATTAGRYRLLVAHGPLPNRQGASSFFTDRSALMQAGARGPASLSPPRPVSTGRLRLTAPCRKRPRGLFLYAFLARVMLNSVQHRLLVPEPLPGLHGVLGAEPLGERVARNAVQARGRRPPFSIHFTYKLIQTGIFQSGTLTICPLQFSYCIGF